MDLITTNRWAVRDPADGAWLRNNTTYSYFTPKFDHARLFTRKSVAEYAALQVEGEVITCCVTAFTEEQK